MSSPAPDFPIARGENPSADDYLTDEELREREVAKLQQQKLAVNVAARKLAVMQEAKTLIESANAITRDRR